MYNKYIKLFTLLVVTTMLTCFVINSHNSVYAETVNTLPTISTIDNQTINEDTSTAEINFTIGDVETAPDSLTVIIASSDTNLLPLDGIVVNGTGAARTITLTPSHEINGTANVTVTVKDQDNGESYETFTLTVTPINDAPSFTKGADKLLLEDAGAQSFAGWAIGISSGPADESGQTVSFTVTNDNNGLFSGQPTVAANGTLTFTLAADASGTATVTVIAQDDGGTANGGVDTSASQTFTINVISINDAPSFTKGADKTLLEDAGAQSFAGWATGISAGPADESGQAVSFAVTNDNNGLFSVQPAVAANGTLTFTPAANASGTATVTIIAHDDGGTANGGVDTSASQTFAITIYHANQAPSFTKGADKTLLEDAGAQSFAGWATGISAGPSDESGQTVSFTATNDNNGLFSVQPAVAADGTLTFTPAANVNGFAIVTVIAQDDGGTANGGIDTSASQSFRITITSVNDAPSFTKGADKTLLEDAGVQTFIGWATGISSGPADESGQTVSFTVTNDNNGLFSIQPAVAADGTLTFTPAANANGTATVSVSLHDDGGTSNSGTDTSASQTFTITITSVNDAPVISDISNQTINEDASTSAIAFTISDNETDTGSLIVTAQSSDEIILPSSGILLTGTGSERELTITPGPDMNGTITVTVTVKDADNGESTETFTLTINPINDLPTITGFSKTANTSSQITFTQADFSSHYADKESTLNKIKITVLPSSGTLKIGTNDVALNQEIAFGDLGSLNYVTSPGWIGHTSFNWQGSDGSAFSSDAITNVTINAVSHDSGGSHNPTDTAPNDQIQILFNNVQSVNSATVKMIEDKTALQINFDEQKFIETLAGLNSNSVISIHVTEQSDVVSIGLNGKMFESMKDNSAVLEVITQNATYTLPASQLNMNELSSQMGISADFSDIRINITIGSPSQDTIKAAADTANNNNYKIVVQPLEFNITLTSGDKGVEVSKFNGYVQRTIAIPSGINPLEITTGVVLNRDGTFSHVPTSIIEIDGKYYAKINSLTNSTYLVISSPKTFKDIEGHWAMEDISDMGSRLVIAGTVNGSYEPDKAITRGEFVSIVVQGLGLMRSGTGKDIYSDVNKNAWYYDAVSIANEYELIKGTDKNHFEPDREITREEAMVVLSRAMSKTMLNMSLNNAEIDNLLAVFADNNNISSWAKQSAAACVKYGIISGKNGMLMGRDNITKAEVAVMVKRFLEQAKLI